MSVTNRLLVATASRKELTKPSTGISSGKLIRARTPIPLRKRGGRCSDHRQSEPVPSHFSILTAYLAGVSEMR